jgi:hypothetical protein
MKRILLATGATAAVLAAAVIAVSTIDETGDPVAVQRDRQPAQTPAEVATQLERDELARQVEAQSRQKNEANQDLAEAVADEAERLQRQSD